MSISALHMFRAIDQLARPQSVKPVGPSTPVVEQEQKQTPSDNPAYILDPSLEAKLQGGLEETELEGVQVESTGENSKQEANLDPSVSKDKTELSEEEQEEVQELEERDREVRTHEQAHLSAAGPYAKGGIKLEYESGPDGKQYATAGSVGIDTSPVEGDPEKSIEKAQVVYSAAMAPAEPSSKDRQVASEAKKMEAEAKSELSKQRQNPEEEENRGVKKAASAYRSQGVQPKGSQLDFRF